MNFSYWFPALTPTVLLGIVAFLFKEMIVTRLRRSVQHEFDEKLTNLRSDLDERGENFKADLRARQIEIDVLRAGALSTIASRQEALDKRRLEAVDQLWSAATTLAYSKNAAKIMQVVNYEKAAKETAASDKARQAFKVFSTAPDKFQSKWEEAAKAQPYVTPMAWAFYKAYSAIGTLAVLQIHMLANGLAGHDFVDHSSIRKLVDATLPHQSKGMEDHGHGFAYYLLDELEERLLQELRASLSNPVGSKESLAQASEIMKEANNIQFSIEKERRLQS